MPQGFNPYRHTVDRAQASRWARFAHAANDAIPTDSAILPLLIHSLQGRIQRMDRTTGRRLSHLPVPLPADVDALQQIVHKQLAVIARLDRTVKKQLAQRIRLYIRVLAQRDHWPDAWDHNCRRLNLGHHEDRFREELTAIERGKLTAFGCLPSVLRLQRDVLYEYMARSGYDGYARSDTPVSWLQCIQHRLYEELAFYHCCCSYRPTLLIEEDALKGPGELIPAILAALHSGCSPSSIRQILKNSSRPTKLPAFLQ